MTRHNLVSRQHAFTLIEALVVMAVGSILIMVAVPGLTSVYLDNRRASVVNELVTGLQVARSEAIARNARVVVCAASEPTQCGDNWEDGVLAFADLDLDRVLDDGEDVVFYTEDLRQLQITSTGFESWLVYRPNGRMMVATVRDRTGEFQLLDHRGTDYGRKVIVDSSGRPRITDADVPAAL